LLIMGKYIAVPETTPQIPSRDSLIVSRFLGRMEARVGIEHLHKGFADLDDFWINICFVSDMGGKRMGFVRFLSTLQSVREGRRGA